MNIKIMPLRPDAPKSIQWVFGFRVWFMCRWRVLMGVQEHEIIPKLMRRIGAI